MNFARLMHVSHYMIVATLIACLLQDPIDSLIRDLGDDSIEVRERAERELIKTGFQAIEALKKAATSNDAEVATRARRVWLTLDRSERERVHDARQLSELFRLNRPENPKLWQGRPWTAYTEGAGFILGAVERHGGMLVYSEYHPFLFRYDEFCQRKGEVFYEISGIVGASGKSATIEKCRQCSPSRVFIRGEEGPLKVKVKGRQTWFSQYDLAFQDPKNGDLKEVGDMTVEVAWPVIKIRSKEGWSTSAANPNKSRFDFTLKPGARSVKPMQMVGARSFGCGSRPAAPKPGWCECESGPISPGARTTLPRTLALDAKAQTGDVPLEDVERITFTVWKPVEIPIDFTVELNPTKAE